MRLIFGCGYLGRRVAERWKANGEQVCAVTRSSGRAEELRAAGIEGIIADVTDPASLQNLPPAETVLYAVGNDRSAGRSIAEVYVDGLRNVLDALPPGISTFIYVSSTGVYGDFGGEWIDESAPCRPERDGGRACLAAEQLLQAHSLGSRAVILRLAGLYGPGRIPRRTELSAGVPIPAPEQGWLNLIHVDDAARVVLAAEQRATPPALYLVSDGNPVQRGDYFRELARLLGAPPPQLVPPDPHAPASRRAASDKRIRNARMLAELQVTLAYPSYREGLAAIVEAEPPTS